VKKTDTRGGLGSQSHNFSYGPMGLLHESNPNTVYTPELGRCSNGTNTFAHHGRLGSLRWASDLGGGTGPDRQNAPPVSSNMRRWRRRDQ
jgi:hypothetical protein